MGRPEWIMVAVVLSVGLVGATVAADPGVDSSGGAVEPAGPIEPAVLADGATGIGESADQMPARGLLAQDGRFELGAQQEFERSTFRVRIDADGDAVWQYRFERPIESDDDRAAYERYAERFRTEETDLYRNFRNQSRELTTAASAETGREMSAENVTRDAGIEQTATQEVGYVELSFEWTNFGRVEEDTVIVGDVFEGGLNLAESSSLIYVAGDGVSFRSVDPEGSTSAAELTESESVTWTGEQNFADRHPRAVLAIDGANVAESDAGASMLWLVGGGVIGLLLVAALAITRYGVFSDARLPGPESPTDSAADTSSADSSERLDADDTATDSASVPEEPLSDEQRVQQLLEDGGGRMKQTAIVEETEWSKSKVSMLLSEMEEEGTIRKIQVGRENIIALDGHEPEAASSPFDDAE